MINLTLWQLSSHKYEREGESHEDEENIPSGGDHGSGRLDVGVCDWGNGTVSKLSRL
jgi:hypothetical protein